MTQPPLTEFEFTSAQNAGSLRAIDALEEEAMRTQDLNRYESLARKLSFGEALDPIELGDVLLATEITREELETRAQFLRDRRRARVEFAKVDSDPEQREYLGMDEGLAIIMAPLTLMAVGSAAALAIVWSLYTVIA